MIVIATMPAVLAGVVAGLLVTNSTLNLQSFMGAIMAIGVGVANVILVLTFSEQYRRAGALVDRAAVDGATSRLRPILMTTFAMIAAMLPVAFGAEQLAPLGRAVIGGQLASTIATLLVLPPIFALVQRGAGIASRSVNPADTASRYYTGEGP